MHPLKTMNMFSTTDFNLKRSRGDLSLWPSRPANSVVNGAHEQQQLGLRVWSDWVSDFLQTHVFSVRPSDITWMQLQQFSSSTGVLAAGCFSVLWLDSQIDHHFRPFSPHKYLFQNYFQELRNFYTGGTLFWFDASAKAPTSEKVSVAEVKLFILLWTAGVHHFTGLNITERSNLHFFLPAISSVCDDRTNCLGNNFADLTCLFHWQLVWNLMFNQPHMTERAVVLHMNAPFSANLWCFFDWGIFFSCCSHLAQSGRCSSGRKRK